MQELTIKTKIFLDKLKGHNKIKKNLLKLIDDYKADSLNNKDIYYDDLIEKLDWNSSKIPNRPWVQVLLPFINKHFMKCTKKLNLKDFHIRAMWFQQYGKNGTHGWHVHEQNYTGVYYLELPKSAPLTELIDPTNIKNRFKIKAKEGDIVLFPSFVIHRSGKMKTKDRKTIVSFNLEFQNIDKQVLKIIKDV